MHFGIISPPVPGHIHPFGALSRELIARGHRVTFFHMPDLEPRVRAEGIDFIPVGQSDHPLGSLPQSLTALGRLSGMAALRFTIRAVAKTTGMILRDGPAAIRNERVSMLLVDQMEPAGGTIAEFLGIPFVTICNALALNREPDVPPPFSPWGYHPKWWARIRNTLGYAISDRLTHPIAKVVQTYRNTWGLRPHSSPEDSFSRLAQISQQTSLFDFPRRHLPENFHYVGPLRNTSPLRTSFPWELLDGRPLIYASLGTLQNSRADVFRVFSEACRGLDAQLVISHGGGMADSDTKSLPGNPVVVCYAPQLELMAKARLTLTHAGLNTVLDSLTYGVPIVAIPITYEQPAIAQRIRYVGVGEAIPLAALSASHLREVILTVIPGNSTYAQQAKAVSESIGGPARGVMRAADLILGGC